MRRNKSLFSRKNFNLIKNLKGNRQMQYAKEQIFLSQIRRVARISKRGGGGYFARVRKVQTTLTQIFIVLESVSHGLSEN